MNELISVIIPIYKTEIYLKKCLESVLQQTYWNIEIILIEDGSPDNCGMICDEYKQRDVRVVVIHKENGGLSAARNDGLDIANGDYITFVDSDDWLDTDFVETLYRLLKKMNAQIALGPLKECGPMILLQKPANRKIENKVFATVEITQKMLYGEKISHAAQGKLYSKSCFKVIRFPVGLLYEDYGTTYYVLQQATKIAYTSDAKYNYLIHCDSIMHKKFDEKNFNLITVSDMVTDELIAFDVNYRIAATRMKIVSYCKLLQLLLNEDKSTQNKYMLQKVKMKRSIKKEGVQLLMDKRTRVRDKVKIASLFFGEKVFAKIYEIALRKSKNV